MQLYCEHTYFVSKDYQQGYDAAALCEPLDKSKSELWQEGWKEYQNDADRSEFGTWY